MIYETIDQLATGIKDGSLQPPDEETKKEIENGNLENAPRLTIPGTNIARLFTAEEWLLIKAARQ